MANQCPNCPKQFPSKSALRNHTGTNNAALRRTHVCRKCEQKFCSQKAMEQHRDSPSHNAMFSCDVCKRSFAEKHALGQHKKSSLHARMLARANIAVGVGASLNQENASSYQTDSRTQASFPTSIKEDTPSDMDSSDECSDDEEAWADEHHRAIWDEDQNWGLCDKDCGWCGHCMDGVDI